MGLGKTLQALIVVASHHYRDSKIPSLIICPSILIDHWIQECSRFIPACILTPIHFKNSGYNEKDIEKDNGKYLYIASYDQLRKNIEVFERVHWNFVVFDEAHLIKNIKSKSFNAATSLMADHKLVMTGTPIQNSVVELWAFFNILMPGFLGTYRQFNEQYVRAILKSRDPSCSVQEEEDGNTALSSLHKRCLPFILRRLKSQVLEELPPKIIQDFFCELSPLQRTIYNSVASCTELETPSNEQNQEFEKTLAFKEICTLCKICNHLSLISQEEHFKTSIPQVPFSISDNCKIHALKILLNILGFGANIASDKNDSLQHKVIVFSQTRRMLDYIQSDLLDLHFKNITYLRLDGTLKSELRSSITTKFNSDPSIDLLLTTTTVGGLGLNLSAADTVIFYDHHWNPMKDLQAMDRAHRLGQKNTVNVYRLICKDTIEEKIMSYQNFKIHVASTVVSHENTFSGLKSSQILPLVDISDSNKFTISSLLDDPHHKEFYDEYEIKTTFKKFKNN